MNITKTTLEGVYALEPKVFTDERGLFIKTFNTDQFSEGDIPFELKESYYSLSKKDVIRGMHFQIPPKDHVKLVYVTNGSILDVILDIRKDSPTFGQYISVELSDQNRKIMYIPRGYAHGFVARSDEVCVVYLQSTVYSTEHDKGIHFDSFGMEWGIESPIMSARDKAFPPLKEFDSPFVFNKMESDK